MWFKRNNRRPEATEPRREHGPGRRETLSPFGVQINALKPLVPWVL